MKFKEIQELSPKLWISESRGFRQYFGFCFYHLLQWNYLKYTHKNVLHFLNDHEILYTIDSGMLCKFSYVQLVYKVVQVLYNPYWFFFLLVLSTTQRDSSCCGFVCFSFQYCFCFMYFEPLLCVLDELIPLHYEMSFHSW